MGKALELVTGIVTAAGASLVAMSPVTGNSFTIRNARKPAHLLGVWALPQASGNARITSPLIHDSNVGITLRHTAANAQLLIAPGDPAQELEPQDNLTVQWSGSAVAGDIEAMAMLIYYEDLPGVDGRFIDAAELSRRAKNLYSSVTTITGVATGQYGGSEAINVDMDALKANTDYAILGITAAGGANLLSVRINGPDFGNVGFGLPFIGNETVLQGRFMVQASLLSGFPTIPVFNASNKGLTTLELQGNENLGANSFAVVMAELKAK